VWLGFFGVVAGAYFQMWQTEVGQNSLAGAFQFFGSCAIVFLIVNMADD
jgi:predicted small integral membrane protein